MDTPYTDVEELLKHVRCAERDVVTPDGVALRVALADIGERYAAFAADVWLTLCASAAIELIMFFTTGALSHQTLVLSAFIAFFVRTLYFTLFEIRWAGSTPGKRFFGLQVIDRRGGPLTPGAIVARNLTREVEFFYPLYMVLAGRSWVRAPWESMMIVLWIVLTAALPLLNVNRLRAGDLLGGTMVIAVPKRALLPDLAEAESTFVFSREQLEYYGIAELQVLEDVLRRPALHDTMALEQEICEKIRRRIQWREPIPPDQVHLFLIDFYKAQRQVLENYKVWGDVRRDKRHAAASASD